MKYDYIIVGLGLAGLAFAEKLFENNKTFIVFENNSQNSSKVAAGMFNPVILKRFTPVWNGQSQIETAIPFYNKLEKKLSNKYVTYVNIYHVLKSITQQNEWFTACDKPVLSDYMVPKIIPNKNDSIDAPFGFGRLINTGKIETSLLLDDYKKRLQEKKLLIKESFHHDELIIENDAIKYKSIKANKIVFCEGFGIKDNPFFKHLPLNEAKGELLIIKAPKLNIDFMLKAAVFVLPLGNDLYKVGATFNWRDKTLIPTNTGKEELIKKLNTFLKVDYEIIDHLAGIRPTVKDRRPLIGKHTTHKNLAILNGLGTRGVMLAPTMAHSLYQHLEKNIGLEKEIDIRRFG